MNLMTWIIAWAVITTAVIVLGYFRLTFGLHEVTGVKFGSPKQGEFYADQGKNERKLEALDMAGMALTAVSALPALAILLIWAVQSGGAAG